jgi:uncharacterized protein YkwD
MRHITNLDSPPSRTSQPDRRPRSTHSVLSAAAAPVFAAALLLTPPAAANAAATTLQVVNAAGTPQTAYLYNPDGSLRARTDGYGRAALELAPGQTVYVRRSTVADPCYAPEGAGVPYAAGSAGTGTIALPVFNTQATEPGSTNEERGLVGLINRERQKRGLSPVQLSAALNRAADALVTAAVRSGQAVDDSCSVASAGARAADAGWPEPVVAGQVGWGTEFARTAFVHLMETPEALLSPDYIAVGVAWVDQDYALLLGRASACAPATAARCELIGDYGDPNAAHSWSDDDEGSSAPASRGTAALRLLSRNLRAQRGNRTVLVKVNCRAAPGKRCSGRLRLTARVATRRAGRGRTAARQTVVIGSATYRLRAGKGTVRVRLGARARRLLAEKRRLRVRVSASWSGRERTARTATLRRA